MIVIKKTLAQHQSHIDRFALNPQGIGVRRCMGNSKRLNAGAIYQQPIIKWSLHTALPRFPSQELEPLCRIIPRLPDVSNLMAALETKSVDGEYHAAIPLAWAITGDRADAFNEPSVAISALMANSGGQSVELRS